MSETIGNFAKNTDSLIMSVPTKIVDVIRQRVSEAENGTLLFSNSFPEYGDEYVGHILSVLVKEGLIYRLCRGVYLKTIKTRFGLAYPPLEVIAAAIAERDNAEILPTGATALNLLGLSTQVPMNPTFITSGSARVINIDGRNITFRRVVPKNFAIKGPRRRLIVQALKAIGEKSLSGHDEERIGALIKNNSEADCLDEDMKVMPVWIKRIFQKHTTR